MPRIARELSAAAVARLKKPGRYAVGGVVGLHLEVGPSGGRSWVLRLTAGGRRRDLGLGSFPSVTLAAARDAARSARDEVWRGVDPVAARKERLRAAVRSERSFRDAAEEYISAHAAKWSNAKHSTTWGASLVKHVYPTIGDRPVRSITRADVLDVLTPIWTKRTETATRLRQRIEAVLAYAVVHGWRDDGPNPAAWKGGLDAALPAPSKVAPVTHHAALAYADVPAFWTRLNAIEGNSARALALVLLTACRSGEIRGLLWSEVGADTITIPASRTKTRKAHVVPLSPAAKALLRAMPRVEGIEHVFPNPKGGALSDMALLAVLRRMKEQFVVHGLRSTFRDWAAETTSHPNHVVEMALAHAVGGVEGAYRRGDLLQARRRLMDDWSRYVTEGGAQLLRAVA